jgi:hypothetical protein
MASELEQDVLQPELWSPRRSGPERVAHRRRSWCPKLLPACVAIVALIGVGALVVSRHNAGRAPIVEVGGGALDATFCFGFAPAVTSGAEYLSNRSSHPVTVISASALATTNAQLADTALVALTGQDFVGQGVGLPTSNTQEAAGLVTKDWASRQFVPTAVIPPHSHARNVHAWQLVFGMRVLHLGQQATLQRVRVTFREGGHDYHLTSQIHIIISGTVALPAHC